MNSRWSSDNRILALGLGASVLLLFTAVNYSLRSFRDAQKVIPPVVKPQYIDQKTEDALMPETLRELIKSPSRSINTVASRIILDRAVHDEDTIEAVLREVQRRDVDAREMALRALHMLVSERGLDDSYVPRIMKAVIVALKHDADENEDKYDVYDPDNNNTIGDRGDTERKSLLILLDLLNGRQGSYKILLEQTRFIRNWLRRQNWGATDEERKDNFAHFVNVHKYPGHNTLSTIVDKLCISIAGVQLMVETGLLRDPAEIGLKEGAHGLMAWIGASDAPLRQRFDPGRAVVSIEIPDSFAEAAMEDPQAAMAIVRDALSTAAEEVLRRQDAGESGTTRLQLSQSAIDAALRQRAITQSVAGTIAGRSHGASVGGSTRMVEQSEEERRLRRRNREVMVLNDGERPLGQEDIIEGTRTRDGL